MWACAGRMRLAADDTDGAPGASGTEKKGPKSFTGTLYTGAVVQRWYGRLAIDVDGIELPQAGRSIPLLLNHGWSEWPNIGAITSVGKQGSTLTCTGRLLSNDTAAKVQADAQDGFPWEMSAGLDLLRVELVPEGVTAEVNGQTVTGPLYIARQSRLREGSMVQQGADPNTNAEMLRRNETNQPGGGRSAPPTSSGDISMSNAAINFAALTAANIRENRPDLVPEILKSAGTAAATVAELSALPGVSDAFVVAQLKAGTSVADATRAHLAALGEQVKGHDALVAKLKSEHGEALKAQADAHEKALTDLKAELQLAKDAAGVAPSAALAGAAGSGGASGGAVAGKIVGGVRLFAGCEGKDPQADWKASEALRACWLGRCRGNEDRAKAAFLRHAADSKAVGEPYAEAV